MLARLLDDHHDLREAAARLRVWFDAPGMPTDPAFLKDRGALVDLLVGHIARKEQYLRALSIGRDEAQARGEPMGTRLNRQLKRWTADAIAADWASYRIAAGSFLDHLLEEMSFEEREIFPEMTVAA